MQSHFKMFTPNKKASLRKFVSKNTPTLETIDEMTDMFNTSNQIISQTFENIEDEEIGGKITITTDLKEEETDSGTVKKTVTEMVSMTREYKNDEHFFDEKCEDSLDDVISNSKQGFIQVGIANYSLEIIDDLYCVFIYRNENWKLVQKFTRRGSVLFLSCAIVTYNSETKSAPTIRFYFDESNEDVLIFEKQRSRVAITATIEVIVELLENIRL